MVGNLTVEAPNADASTVSRTTDPQLHAVTEFEAS